MTQAFCIATSDMQCGAGIPLALDVDGAPLQATAEDTAHSLQPSAPLAASNDEYTHLEA